MFFGFLITNLPCHIVTLQSAIHVSCGYSILNIIGVVLEVIRLDVIF